jgi:hypothetical protein
MNLNYEKIRKKLKSDQVLINYIIEEDCVSKESKFKKETIYKNLSNNDLNNYKYAENSSFENTINYNTLITKKPQVDTQINKLTFSSKSNTISKMRIERNFSIYIKDKYDLYKPNIAPQTIKQNDITNLANWKIFNNEKKAIQKSINND